MVLRKGIPRAPIKADLTAEHVRSLFTYDETTGLLRWKEDRLAGRGRFVKVAAGEAAGWRNRSGYMVVTAGGRRQYMVHRIIWLFVHGKWPSNFIDHINGKRDDNRLSNLRDVPLSVNSRNSDRFRNSRWSNTPGVTEDEAGRWRAHVWRNGKQYHLGMFATREEAARVVIAVNTLLADEEQIRCRLNQAERANRVHI
jgi:hypothetical protein